MDDGFLLKLEPPCYEDTWEPGFQAGRCLVYSRLGPWEKFYLRPRRFQRRFYHQLFPMPIEAWPVTTQVELHGGLCTMHVALQIRFQATLRYVEHNPEALPDINAYIRTQMAPVIVDAIEARLLALTAGNWIDSELSEMEQRLAMAVNETLALHQIQCRTVCSLKPEFADLVQPDDGGFVHERIYRAILNRQFRFEQLRNQEAQRREEEKLRNELEQIRLKMEGQLQKQAEDAKNKLRQLARKRKQLAEQREIEKQLHQEALAHQSQVEALALEEKIQRTRKRWQVDDLLLREKTARMQPLQENRPQSKTSPSDPAKTDVISESHSETADAGNDLDQVLKDLEYEAARKLREKDQQIEALEEKLSLLRSDHQSTQLTIDTTPVTASWLDRLAQLAGRLLFFYRHRWRKSA